MVCFFSGANVLLSFTALWVGVVARKIPEDFPDDASEYAEGEWKTYGQDLGFATLGYGVGFGIILAIVMFFRYALLACSRPYPSPDIREEKFATAKGIVGASCLSCVICLTVMALYSINLRQDANDSMDHSITFSFDYADFLCSTEHAVALYDCDVNSIGGFIFNAETRMNNEIDAAIALIDNMNSLLTDLDNIKAQLEDAVEDVANMDTLAGEANDVIDNIIAELDYLSDPDNFEGHTIDGIPTSDDIPSFDADDLQALSDATDDLNSAITTVDDTRAEVVDIIEGDLADTRDDLESDRLDVQADLDDLGGDLVEQSNDAVDFRRDLEDFQNGWWKDNEDYSGYLVPVCFVWLMLLVLIGTVGMMCRSRGIARCSGFCIFFFHLYFSVLLGIMLLSSYVVEDGCKQHLTLIEANTADETITIGDTTVYISDKIRPILFCPKSSDGDPATNTNNLIDILGVGSEFDITEDTEQAVADLQQSKEDLDYHAEVQEARDQLVGMDDAINLDLSDGVDLDAVQTDVTDILARLPPADYARLNTTHQTKLETEFGADWGFGFTDFNSELDTINGVLAQLDTVSGDGVITSVDLENIVTFDSDYVVNNGYEGRLAASGAPSGEYTTLRNAVSVTDGYSEAVQKSIDVNADVVPRVESIGSDVEQLSAQLAEAEGLQSDLGTIQSTLNSQLDGLDAALDEKVAEIDAIVLGIEELNAFVLTANSYTRCGWIASSYDALIEGTMCTDVKTDLRLVSYAAGAFIFLVFVAFFPLSGAGKYLLTRTQRQSEGAGALELKYLAPSYDETNLQSNTDHRKRSNFATAGAAETPQQARADNLYSLRYQSSFSFRNGGMRL